MKFFYDLLPVILFFVSYKIYDIFIATAVAIAATLVQILYMYFKKGSVDRMLLFNGAMITVLGGLTIMLQDKAFIMWKPSLIYWAFAIILLCSNRFFGKNLIKLAMGAQIQLKDWLWSKLNFFSSLFFVFLGFINLYVAYNFSENTWVNFKLFGLTALLFLFFICLAIYVSRVNKES
ncbi:MAG: septation protein A [Methylophilaceae bacterium]